MLAGSISGRRPTPGNDWLATLHWHVRIGATRFLPTAPPTGGGDQCQRGHGLRAAAAPPVCREHWPKYQHQRWMELGRQGTGKSPLTPAESHLRERRPQWCLRHGLWCRDLSDIAARRDHGPPRARQSHHRRCQIGGLRRARQHTNREAAAPSAAGRLLAVRRVPTLRSTMLVLPEIGNAAKRS
jgi:hypothetical protein